MDRIAPTRRPDAAAVSRQKWRDLLFVHWPLPVEAVRAVVPAPLELDLYQGVAYVGLVPFAMRDIRPVLVPARAGLNFLETNLRTYVHLDGEPGIWFFSLEASSRIAVSVAKLSIGLPYFLASMSMTREESRIAYTSVRRSGSRPSLDLRYTVGDLLGRSVPGTVEFFLLERYLLWSVRGQKLLRVQVHHQPYPAHRAEIDALETDLLPAAGLPRQQGDPSHVHFAPGVDVDIFAPTASGAVR